MTGNESDYIIVSLVRSDKLGFLQENRRVNVMLTRCKKAMIICTNRAFVEGVAKNTLVGKLQAAVGMGQVGAGPGVNGTGLALPPHMRQQASANSPLAYGNFQ